MELSEGQRLSTSEQGGYTVGKCLSQTAWHRLYAARKVFCNYRYAERELYEAAEDEWLEVLIRASPGGDSPAAQQSAKLLRYESQEVLSGHGSWFAQPIDLLEFDVYNGRWHAIERRTSQHKRPANRPGASIQRLLVMSRPHGRTLREWKLSSAVEPAQALHVSAELLDLLTLLHEGGQILGGFSPEDFLIDETGRWTCLASDRVVPLDRIADLRPCFPPERYPADGSASETLDGKAMPCPASDLYSWAALSVFLLTGKAAQEISSPLTGQNWALDAQTRGLLEQALATAAEQEGDLVTALSAPGYQRSPSSMVLGWSEALARCLNPNLQHRPGSIDELRLTATKHSSRFSLKNLWRQVAGGK